MAESDISSDPSGRLARDFGLYTVAQAVPTLTDVAALMIFTRVFLPAEYGQYALIASAVTVLNDVLYGWVVQSVPRFEPQIEDGKFVRITLGLVTSVNGAFVFVATAGLYLIAPMLGPYEQFYVAGVVLTVVMGTSNIFISLLRARLQSKLVVLYQSSRSILGLLAALVVALVVLKDILGWIWGRAIGYAILAAAYLAFLVRSVGLTWYRGFEWDLFIKMLYYGFPLIGWLVGTTLLNFSDRLIIDFLRGNRETGIYASNYSIVHYGLTAVFLPFYQSAQPILMNLWNGNNEAEIRSMIAKMTRYLFLIGVPVTVLFAGMSRPLSDLFLGSEYVEGAIIIPIVSLGVFLWNVATIGQKGLEIKNRTKALFGGVTLAVITNVVANIPLILTFGYVGAAFSTVISFGVYAAYVYLLSRRYIAWEIPWRNVLNTAVGAVGAAAPFAGLVVLDQYRTSYTIIASSIGGVAYLGVLYLLGEIRREDIAELRELFDQT